MPDYTLVPVDYQPDFSDYSLVPVDYDPFSADGTTQLAQTQPEGQPQPLANGAGQPNVGTQFSGGNKTADIARGGITGAPQLAPSVAPSSNGGSNQQQLSMASHAAYSKCVDKCLHLLPSPTGDLQSSEFRLCVAQCMGRL
jgi:hypothetical protein